MCGATNIQLNSGLGLTHVCGGYSWLSTWFPLALTKTQATGNTWVGIFLAGPLDLENVKVRITIYQVKWTYGMHPFIYLPPFLGIMDKHSFLGIPLESACLLLLCFVLFLFLYPGSGLLKCLILKEE